MNIQTITIGIVIGLVLGAGVGYGVTSYQLSELINQINLIKLEADKVPNLQQQITTLSNEKSSLQTQVTTLTNEKSSLQTQISELQSQISSLSSDNSNLESQINSLQTQILSKNNEITSLQKQVSSIDPIFVSTSFSRTQDTAYLLQQWILKANHTIKLMLYLITQDSLAESLISAKNRGIDIDVVIDDEWVSASGSDFQMLLNTGIDIRSDNRAGTMHHKVMIIDDYIIVTGSYNWSNAAEDSNDENVIILKSESISSLYLSEFSRIWSQTNELIPQPSPTPTPSPSPPPSYNGPFWASEKSNIYHLPTCYWAQQISADNLIIFNTRSEAEAAGYRACYVCTP